MPTRNIDVVVKLIGKGETSYSNARIYSSKDLLISLKIVNGQTTGGFGLGGTICPSLTAELHKTAVVAVGDKVKAELIVYNGGGNLTMASEFTVDNIKRKADGTLSVNALGNMIKLAKNYVSELEYPTTQLAVLEEIASQSGYELHPLITTELINNPEIQSAPVKGKAEDGTTLYYTRREILGYAAAINGGAAYIDQYGRIDIARHNDTGETFTHEQVFNESITEPFTVEAVKWSSTGLSYSLGDDYNENTIEFYNPLIYNARELIAHNLETDLIGFGYDGATIKKQGCGYYEIGDIVHYTDIGGNSHKLLVLGIVYEFNDGYFTETLYSLSGSPTQRNYTGSETVISLNAPGSSGGSISLGALDTYTYLADNSIEYNGLTYTIEKDDTGLITRITDDDLGEFEPKNSGNITDVAFHNAVLTAVAMLCGLPKPLPDDTLTDMVEYRYNIESYEQTSAALNLLNQADGADIPLAFTGATLNSDNVYIVGNGNSRGSLAYTAPNGELNECTFYMVARGATVAALRFFAAASTFNSFGVGEGFSSQNGMWAVGAQANTTLFTSQFSSLTTAVLALRHYNGTLYFYVNGEYVGVCPIAAIPVTTGTFWLGITAGNWSDSGGYYYYDFAFAESAHDEDDIIQNSKYLMRKYGI